MMGKESTYKVVMPLSKGYDIAWLLYIHYSREDYVKMGCRRSGFKMMEKVNMRSLDAKLSSDFGPL